MWMIYSRVVCCTRLFSAARWRTRDCERWRIGDVVMVSADEPVKTPIEGEIVSHSVDHIAIRRLDPTLGEVVVHFPRMGYVVTDA